MILTAPPFTEAGVYRRFFQQIPAKSFVSPVYEFLRNKLFGAPAMLNFRTLITFESLRVE
jgi:hypothetical protein